jgi:dihydroorotate dehydrogenase (fumarate)
MDDEVANATYHPEAYEYFRADLAVRYGAREYCKRIEAMRDAVAIPVIASINCFSDTAWTGFARDIENAGAQALELNVAFPPLEYFEEGLPARLDTLSAAVAEARSQTAIPIAVKAPPAGLYVAPMVQAFQKAGARGCVLFNRFFSPEVDIESISLKREFAFSGRTETAMVRRYIALLANRVSCDLAASTGIHEAEDAIAMLLVGARAVEVVSALYLHGRDRIGVIRDGIARWMERQGFAAIEDFRGRLASDPGDKTSPFGRLQYIKSLTDIV